ncbi:hypothetical protein FC83_GL001954 [Agrilactobacillus composti DSM 18527 = JCM 14202]|uniref:Uncharacterized protein n=1 Tax=Agrilactobacillus composti DSM 18527 = JCM 14202 TaxID=1423734 RepID=A0A0R1XY94_9LACO|nr:hypothetical protein FC83_GL001954 [Agrilactobacillus composti DSM 18527 = JCM 14202]
MGIICIISLIFFSVSSVRFLIKTNRNAQTIYLEILLYPVINLVVLVILLLVFWDPILTTFAILGIGGGILVTLQS